MVWDTLLIDDFDTAALFTVVEDWDGMESAAGLRGSNYSSPLRDGEVWRRKSRDVGSASIGIAVLPSDPATGAVSPDRDERIAQMNRNWQRIKRLVTVRRRPLTLKRRMSLPDSSRITVTAVAEMADRLDAAHLGGDTLRAVLTFRLLDGCWFEEDSNTFHVSSDQPAFLPAPGTVDTGNMTITLTEGVGVQTLTNVSAGVWITYDWSGAAAGAVVTIDVPKFAVRRQEGDTTYVAGTRMKHGGDDRFMIIDPDLGDNEFTLSSGKATIEYRGAFL